MRTSEAPRIDGVLSESLWQASVPASGFEQYDPNEGAPATERTIVRVLYDDHALYVGVMCYDAEPAAIVRQLTRRDRPGVTDKFSVIIDSYHDHATAFLFSGTASGVQSDGILSEDGRVYDTQWDAVWDYDAAVTAEGWSAEFKIPFSALRFTPQDGEYVWGVNFRRFIARKNETDEWVMVPRKETPVGIISIVSKIGHLSGIRDIHPPLHVEVLPYQVSKLNYLAQPQPFPTRQEFRGTAGVDLKYGLSNNVTFDLAVNPDFGQVEVDQAVLNLTVFETFYPEKRPFFLEGSPIFSFGTSFDTRPLHLWYSRRIGRQPSAYDTLAGRDTLLVGSNAAFAEKPEVTTILAAGKLTGRTADGLDFGILSAVTDREEAVLEDLQHLRRIPIQVEPRASYSAVRLRQSILENSTVGMMATGALRDGSLPALTGGLDWNLRFNDGMYALDGYIAGSDAVAPLTGGPDRLTGGAGKIGVGKLQDEHWLAYSVYDFSNRNFSINDLGYFGEPHEHGGFTGIIYKEDRAAVPVRRWSLLFESGYRWNWSGIPTTRQVEFLPSWEFRNFWTFSIDYVHAFAAYDDENRLSFGGMTSPVSLYLRPAGELGSASLQTDTRQAVSLGLQLGYRAFSNGARELTSSLQLTVRPSASTEFSPQFTAARTRDEEAWPVGYFSSNGLNLFGDRDIDEYDLSLRGIVTFTPRITMQFFTQVFLAKGRYSGLRELVSPEGFRVYPSLPGVEFNEKVLNANLVFRWEYLPGSTLYLVWTQARSGLRGAFDNRFSEDFQDAFRLPMDNVVLAKVSYWWSL